MTLQPGRRRGVVVVPSSKSIAHREIIAAALSGAPEPLVRGWSKDLLATRHCLQAMQAGDPVWPCGESGTTLRLLDAVSGVMGWKGAFQMEGRLADRPRLPFTRQSRYVIPGNVSSQFVSGLLMALPLADWDSEIVIEGPLQSLAYVHLTEDVLRASSITFDFSSDPLTWKIPGGQHYRFPGGRAVEGDWSNAAPWLAMGVAVEGLKADSRQGDRVVCEYLETIRTTPDATLDVSQCPDLYPVLAAYAAAIGRDVVFTGTARLRLKESDRLASTAAMIAAVRAGEMVDTCNDHRIAMAAAVMAVYAQHPITMNDGHCVAKSYPDFWRDFDSLERIV